MSVLTSYPTNNSLAKPVDALPEETANGNQPRTKSKSTQGNGVSESYLYQSSGSEDPGSETIYVRDHVYVYPGPSGSTRIMGRLSLIRKLGEGTLFLAWLPYSPPSSPRQKRRSPSPPTAPSPCAAASSWLPPHHHHHQHQPPPARLDSAQPPPQTTSNMHHTEYPSHPHNSARTLYAVHPIALSSVRAIRRHTPTIGWHNIILVLHSGVTLPPLYFYSGGVKQLLGVLKQHTCLVKSHHDPTTYLVNDTQDPLMRSMSVLNLQEVGERAAWTSSPSPSTTAPSSAAAATTQDNNLTSTTSCSSHQPPASFSSIVLSRITNLACSTILSASTHQSNNRDEVVQGDEDRAESGVVVVWNEEEEEQAQSGAGVGVSSGMGVKRMSEPCMSSSSLARRATERSQHEEDQDQKEEEEAGGALHASTSVGCFELLESGMGDCRPLDSVVDESGGSAGLGRGGPEVSGWHTPPPPLTLDEWQTFLDHHGRVVDPNAVRARAFYGGVSGGARAELWPFLLGYMPWSSTSQERQAIRQRKHHQYLTIKAQWQSVSDEQAGYCTKFRQRRARIKKDVVRTDRLLPFYASTEDRPRNPNVDLLRDILMSYTTFNFDLAYCQGMNDLLSPLLFTLKDEAETFWCFKGLMEVMESNFHRDQNGMHAQLLALSNLVQMLDPQLHHHLASRDCINFFFCYRWILLAFKREFEYNRVLRLWDALWSQYPCRHFHLFVCVAILQRHRAIILNDLHDFDSLLIYISQLAGAIDLEAALRDAELLFQFAGQKGQAVLPNCAR